MFNHTLNYSNDAAVAENNGTAVNQTAEEIVDDYETIGNWTFPSNWTFDD